MLKTLLLIPALAVIAAAPAMASESRCNVPQAEWQPLGALEAKLKADGWTEIKKIEASDGCYEVYGKNEKGEKVEVFIDPKTFVVVGSDD